MSLSPLLTVDETAEMLRVQPATVRGWIRSGKLRASKFGREWRVMPGDLEHFINQNANRPPV